MESYGESGDATPEACTTSHTNWDKFLREEGKIQFMNIWLSKHEQERLLRHAYDERVAEETAAAIAQWRVIIAQQEAAELEDGERPAQEPPRHAIQCDRCNKWRLFNGTEEEFLGFQDLLAAAEPVESDDEGSQDESDGEPEEITKSTEKEWFCHMNYPPDPTTMRQKCDTPQAELDFGDGEEAVLPEDDEGEGEEGELDQGNAEEDRDGEQEMVPQINYVGRRINSHGRAGTVTAWKADTQRYVVAFDNGDTEDMHETRVIAQMVAIDEPQSPPQLEPASEVAPALAQAPKRAKRAKESETKVTERLESARQLLTIQGLAAALVHEAWTKAFRDQLENEKQNRPTGNTGTGRPAGPGAQVMPPSIRDRRGAQRAMDGVQRAREHGPPILARLQNDQGYVVGCEWSARSIAKEFIRRWPREQEEEEEEEEEEEAYQQSVMQSARQRKVQALKDINRTIVQVPGDGHPQQRV